MIRQAIVTAVGVALVAGSLPLAGCESSQDKSRRLARESRNKLQNAKGLVVKRENPDVRIVSTATLRDENGAAVVVRMRNVGSAALAQLPVAVELDDARGRALYKNDAPGLETSLVQAAMLGKGGELWWVNDQVTAASRPAKVRALVGDAKAAAGKAPRIVLRGARVVVDPVDGVAVKGQAINRSGIDQRRLVIYCVALKGGRVVAAGRAIIERLRPDKPTRFTIFFIGDPRGARLALAAPPTNLRPGRR
jgi:hypothetical protein